MKRNRGTGGTGPPGFDLTLSCRVRVRAEAFASAHVSCLLLLLGTGEELDRFLGLREASALTEVCPSWCSVLARGTLCTVEIS